MNYFWDQLEGLPGIRPIRVDESTGSNMAGRYNAQGLYYPHELHGLPVETFCEALRAEAPGSSWPGGNKCLHTHNFFQTFDLMGIGKPGRIACNDRDVRPYDAACKKSEEIRCFSVPWFKHFDKEWIDRYAAAFKKVIENHEELPEGRDSRENTRTGRWYGTTDEG